MKLLLVATLLALTSSHASAVNNNGYETVRIAAPGTYRCINSKADEITLSVLRVSVQKTSGFFVADKTAGIAVLTQLNADSNTTPAKTPSVNMVDISGESTGQVFLPLEYSIANRLQLLEGTTETTELLVSMYLEKTRGSNGFGDVLKAAGDLLGKLPIPANPYLTAANTFISYANTTVQNETTGGGAQEFASLDLKFADRNYPDEQSCRNGGGEGAEAIAVIAATGGSGPNLLTLGNLDQRYCWRYTTDGASEIQYASKPIAGCSPSIPESEWTEPSNDYTMLLLTAAVVLPTPTPAVALLQPHTGGLFRLDSFGGGKAGPPAADLGLADQRLKDLTASRRFCDHMGVSRALCGVN
ncbi:MAG: hypothetical protein WAK26_14845 [Terracidiphilus sp.]|jgi:hypothetical protein